MLPKEDNGPVILHRAMRYSVFAGGKRIRPILAMAAADVVGGESETVLPLAVSLECIHTYSLIHDDLPAMDNDDLRRGKPTAHKVFGEAVAILAGDALLTFAFEVLCSPGLARVHPPDRLMAVVGELASAAGPASLIAGQVMDIISEGQPVDARTVEQIVRDKTAALIRASLRCGARLAGGSPEEIQILGRFGDHIGKAFQIRDDLLDLEGDPEKLGKAVKKDEQRGKATYPMLLGPDGARDLMRDLIASALEVIQPLGRKADILTGLAEYLGRRAS
ncbi:MAG: polyprenyl synthetase family protein [Desulfomonile tiedjei]|nr:polyprenyl synthetase family protein [Desulfomonile tiedjei]